MKSRAPKLCVEVGKYGLLIFKRPIQKSPLTNLADAFEVKTPRHLASLHTLRTNPRAARDAELQRLHEILATGKEITYHHSGIIDNSFTEEFVNPGHIDLLEPTGIKYASFTLGPSCLGIVKRDAYGFVPKDTLSREKLWEHIHNRMQVLQARFPGRLGFENELYQTGGGVEYVAEPAFITEFFRKYPKALFLLDLSHARVTAATQQVDPIDYLRNLPLERVGHIHLSQPNWREGPRLIDTHLAPQAEDFAYLELVLTLGARPEYATIEYYRDEGRLIESYSELRKFFRHQRSFPLVSSFIQLALESKSLDRKLDALSGYNYKAISGVAKEHLSSRQESILKEIQGLENKRGIVADTPEKVAAHITNVRIAFIQARLASYGELASSKDPHQLERLCLCPDKARAKKNLSRLKQTIHRYPLYLWQTLIDRHDDGKIISGPMHERETGELLRKFRILDKLPYSRLSPREKLLLGEIMEHHTNLGSSFIGDNSLLILKEVFECTRLKELLLKADKKIDLETARMFLDMWAAFTCLDACGLGPKGILTNSRLEYYYGITDDLYNILQRNADSYESALSEIEEYAKGKFLMRLSGLLISYDSKGDSKLTAFQEDNSHLSFYAQNINQALSRLLAKGEIKKADWKEFQNSFHKILELPYCVSYYIIAWSNPGVDKDSPQRDAQIYEGFIKFLILLNRAASGCRDICVIKEEAEGLMRSVTDLDDYLPQIRAAIDQARDLVQKGNKLYFADADGKKVDKSPVIYRKRDSLIVDLSPLKPV